MDTQISFGSWAWDLTLSGSRLYGFSSCIFCFLQALNAHFSPVWGRTLLVTTVLHTFGQTCLSLATEFPQPKLSAPANITQLPPINDLTSYSFKAKLLSRKTHWLQHGTSSHGLGKLQCKEPPHMQPYRLVGKRTQSKCLFNNWNLLPLGCWWWSSRVQWASRAKTIHSNVSKQSEFEKLIVS